MTNIGSVVEIYLPYLTAKVVAHPETLDERLFTKEGKPTSFVTKNFERLRKLCQKNIMVEL